MERTNVKLTVVHNIGLVDRIVRALLGSAMIAGAVISMYMTQAIMWETYAILIAVYPLLTAILGWDPFYSMFRVRSCNLEGGRNLCGTLPFEVDATLGNNPVPKNDYDHSLYGSVHEHQDQEPRKAA
jgi:hypothetical protein